MVAAPTKLCRKCGRDLPRDAFPSDGSSPCRECRAFQQAAWYQRNKKRVQAKRVEYQREYRKRNPGLTWRKTPPKYNPAVSRKAKRKWLAKPGKLDQTRAYCRAYYAANRERILTQKKSKKLARVLR